MMTRINASFIYTSLFDRPPNRTVTIFNSSTLLAVAAITKVEGAFFLQELQVAEYVLFHFLRRGLGIDLLQILNNLFNGVLAVAALDDFEAGANQAKGAFGHLQHALLVVFSESATGSQTRAAI